MKNKFYKPILRPVYERDSLEPKQYFIAYGKMDDGHIVYVHCDHNGHIIEEMEYCQYIQMRLWGNLWMVRI